MPNYEEGMNIDKAIELISADINDDNVDWDSPLGRAYRLGRAYKLSFEALKRLKYSRNHPSGFELELLPGETED